MYHEQGSIEKALQGEVHFKVGEVLSEAWSQMKGAKLTIFIAIIGLFAILVALQFIVALIAVLWNIENVKLLNLIYQVVSTPTMTFFWSAIIMMGIHYINGETIRIGNLFSYLGRALPIMAASLIVSTMSFLGFLMLIIPGVYLFVAYSFTYYLMLDKNMGIWEAMETSRKAVTKHWFRIFGLIVVLFLIFTLSAMTIVGVFWTAPWIVMSFSILYTRLFGYEGAKDTVSTETLVNN